MSTQEEIEKTNDRKKKRQWHCQNQLCQGCPAEFEECSNAEEENVDYDPEWDDEEPPEGL